MGKPASTIFATEARRRRQRESHYQIGRQATMLCQTFFMIQVMYLLFPSGGGHNGVVQANPLKRFFMMRRMMNGDTGETKQQKGRKPKLPKGSEEGIAAIPPAATTETLRDSTNDDYFSLNDDTLKIKNNVRYTGHSDDDSVERSEDAGEPVHRGWEPAASPHEIVIRSQVEPTTSVAEPLADATRDENDSWSSRVCIDPHQLEQVQDQLIQAQNGQSEILKRHELYRQESESRLQNLTRANESAYKIAKVQEDFVERITKMQNKVEANLEAARATIVAREEALEALKREMMENEARLKADANKRIEQAQKDWKKQLSDVQADLNVGNDKIRAEYEGRLRQSEEEKAILKGEKKLMAENFEKLEQKYEMLLRNQEIALKAYLEVNLENEANKKKEAFRDTLIAELESIKASSESTIAQLTIELNNLNATSSATIQELQSKYEMLKQTSETKIEQLTADYVELQRSSQEKIEEITRNAEKDLEELQRQSAEKLENAIASLESSHDEAMLKIKAQVTSLQLERKGLVSTIKSTSTKLRSTEEEYKRATRDAEYWQSKFEHRPYVNLTQVTTDVSVYASTAAAPVIQSTRNLYETHVASSATKSKELYDNHLRPAVDLAASVANPVYKHHVAPHLESAKATISQTSKSMFDGLKTQYEVVCPSAMTSLRDMEKSMGMLLPDSIVESTRYSCLHADESVAAFLKATVIVLLVLYRRSLWRLMLGSVNMTLSLLCSMMVAPWRLALKREKIKKEKPDFGEMSGTGGTPPRKPGKTRLF